MNPAVSAPSPRGAEVAEHRLEPGRGAVSQIADGAAGEPRQIGHQRRSKVGHQAAQRLDEGPVAFRQLSRPLDRRLAVARAQDQERILAEERIPSDVLAAFHAFQEKRVVRVLGDLQERRDRREQVGDDLLAHRHERAAPGQLLELVERCDLHMAISTTFNAEAAEHAEKNRSSSALSGLSALDRCAAHVVNSSSRLIAASRITFADGQTPVHHSNCWRA